MKSLKLIITAAALAFFRPFSSRADIPSPPQPLKAAAKSASDTGTLFVLAIGIAIIAAAILTYKLIKNRGE